MKALKIDQFTGYRFLSNLRWSPDGERAVFTVTQCDMNENGYVSNLWLYENGKLDQLSGMDEEKSFFWEDNTHILFPACRSKRNKKRRENGERFTAYYRLSTDGGEALPAFELPMKSGELFPADGHLRFFLSDIDCTSPDEYAAGKSEKSRRLQCEKANADYTVLEEHPFWSNGSSFKNHTRTALFIYDGKNIKRASEPYMSVENAVYHDGAIYYTGEEFSHVSSFKSGLFRYDIQTGKNTPVFDPVYKYYVKGLDTADGKLLLYLSEGKRYSYEESPDIWLLDTASGELTPMAELGMSVGNSTGSDCRMGSGYQQRAVNSRAYYSVTEGGACHLKYADICGMTHTLYGGEGSIDCFDVSISGEVLAIAMLDGKLQELYSISEKGIRRISHFNDKALNGCYVAPYEKLTVQSEGTNIDGWVLKPIDFDPEKQYPAILDIHGGPRTAYGEIFYHEMQYWAGQGYFVFFCNPIGSDGRGDAFADIYGKYGEQDYRNIMDFTDEVLKRYPIDPSRVAVIGGSYGGFMTNWIIGHTDRFCCAATQRSISNWISFYGTSDIGIVFGEFQQAADIFTGADKLWKHSPLAYASNFSTPTLIIHSDCDYRCPIQEGYQLFTALQEKNVDSRMVIFKGENHELSRGGKPLHRIKRLTEISDWIKKYTR